MKMYSQVSDWSISDAEFSSFDTGMKNNSYGRHITIRNIPETGWSR